MSKPKHIEHEQERVAAIPFPQSRLCDVRDWQDGAFRSLARDIFGDPAIEPIQHRKLWEFTSLVEALRRAELLDAQSLGLSVAAGSERVLYYLANHVGRIVASDIYGEGEFSENEAAAEMLENPQQFAPFAYEQNALRVLGADALALPFEDNTFDFSFSLSSIEHFGGLQPAIASVEEMLRVVRPGGLVVVATDVSVNASFLDQVFSESEINRLVRSVPADLVDELSFARSEESLDSICDMTRDDLTALPHISLQHLDCVFTSVCLVFYKPSAEADVVEADFAERAALLDRRIVELREKPVRRLELPFSWRLRQIFRRRMAQLRYLSGALLRYPG